MIKLGLDQVLMKKFQEHLGAKKVQENWLSVSKIRNFFCQFSHFGKTFFKLEIWILMMISMAKNSIWTVFTCIPILDKNTPKRLWCHVEKCITNNVLLVLNFFEHWQICLQKWTKFEIYFKTNCNGFKVVTFIKFVQLRFLLKIL